MSSEDVLKLWNTITGTKTAFLIPERYDKPTPPSLLFGSLPPRDENICVLTREFRWKVSLIIVPQVCKGEEGIGEEEEGRNKTTSTLRQGGVLLPVRRMAFIIQLYAVEAFLTDTLVSGQLYLRPPWRNPFLPSSHTNFVFTHSGKRPAPVTVLPRLSAYGNFDCICIVLDYFLVSERVLSRISPEYGEFSNKRNPDITIQG